MSPTGNSDIHEALADAMSSRPYTHRQDVDTGITAVITVEEDMRFLRSTLRSVLTQNVLPGVVIIADRAHQFEDNHLVRGHPLAIGAGDGGAAVQACDHSHRLGQGRTLLRRCGQPGIGSCRSG